MRFMALVLGLLATTAMGKSLLLLPVTGDVEKTEDMAAINRLYREAVENQFKGQLVLAPDSLRPCEERDCAMKAASGANADEVVYASLHRLGTKWIFASAILHSDGSKFFSQRLSATSIEDLEPVTKRIADAVLNRKSIEEVASLDNITDKEENKAPSRRRSLYSGGFALGYLFPVNNSYAIVNNGQSCGYDSLGYYTCTSTQTPKVYSQLIRLSWMNSWEFRDNLLLNADFVWAIPHVVGGDFNLNYVFNRTDYSPFLGGGIGLHYVIDPSTVNTDKRNSGPALNVQGGMMLFRTYDVHVMLRGQYQVVFNSDVDHGFAADVGVTFRRHPEEQKGSGWGTFWKYYLIGALVLSIVGAAAK